MLILYQYDPWFFYSTEFQDIYQDNSEALRPQPSYTESWQASLSPLLAYPQPPAEALQQQFSPCIQRFPSRLHHRIHRKYQNHGQLPQARTESSSTVHADNIPAGFFLYEHEPFP